VIQLLVVVYFKSQLIKCDRVSITVNNYYHLLEFKHQLKKLQVVSVMMAVEGDDDEAIPDDPPPTKRIKLGKYCIKEQKSEFMYYKYDFFKYWKFWGNYIKHDDG